MTSKGKMAYMTQVGGPLTIKEFPLTEPAPGMARLGLVAGGVCGTDLHILKGKIPVNLPMALGHEFVGRIEAISLEGSKNSDLAPGDNVIVYIACPCGTCKLCEQGDDANCLNMGVTNGGNPDLAPHFYGGYGEYNYSPVKNLIKIPKSLDPKMASVYACAGPTVIHADKLARRANCSIDKADVAVVQGLGPVGSFAVMYLASMDVPNIIAVTGTANDERKKLAQKLGASEVFDLATMGADGVTSKIKEISGGIGADLVIEASGNPSALPQGMAMLRNRGLYLVPGQYSNSGDIAISPQTITFNALHIIGSSQYSASDVEDYLAFLEKHTDLHSIILNLATSYTVAEANQALEDAESGKKIKTLLVK